MRLPAPCPYKALFTFSVVSQFQELRKLLSKWAHQSPFGGGAHTSRFSYYYEKIANLGRKERKGKRGRKEGGRESVFILFVVPKNTFQHGEKGTKTGAGAQLLGHTALSVRKQRVCKSGARL